MTDITQVPTADLLVELRARMKADELAKELEKKRRAADHPPRPLPSPDFTALREMIVREVDNEIAEQESSKDFKEYAYEAAMTAVYGDAYFDWRNKQQW